MIRMQLLRMKSILLFAPPRWTIVLFQFAILSIWPSCLIWWSIEIYSTAITMFVCYIDVQPRSRLSVFVGALSFFFSFRRHRRIIIIIVAFLSSSVCAETGSTKIWRAGGVCWRRSCTGTCLPRSLYNGSICCCIRSLLYSCKPVHFRFHQS